MGNCAVMLRVSLVVAALLLAALGYQTWRAERAVKRAAAAELRAEQAELYADTLEEARQQDTRIADALNGFRNDQANANRAFGRKLDSIKVTHEVPNESGTCTVRDPALYRGLFNEAVSGPAPGTGSLF